VLRDQRYRPAHARGASARAVQVEAELDAAMRLPDGRAPSARAARAVLETIAARRGLRSVAQAPARTREFLR